MLKFASKAVHSGHGPDRETGAIMPPVYMTSTYVQSSPGQSISGYDYTRAGNPNFTMLETLLASLESATYATVFSAGLGALTALLSTLQAGDKVAAIDGIYGGTYRLFHAVFQKFGIEFLAVSTDLSNLEHTLASKPKWLILETPTNPLLEIYDIASIADDAKKYGVQTLVDNTFASPFFQNPLQWGASAVWHSTTKYIGGHSDVIGGAIITNDIALKEELDFARKSLGLNPSPFDAWLTIRGVKTLALRMERHEKNALAVALFLTKHPLVKKVYYPGLDTHSNHLVAKKQMSGYSGMVSAEFNLPEEDMKKLISSFTLFALAESLGGVESLVNHPASMTHASIPLEERHRQGLSDGLVRFSVGIEDSEDLTQDLSQALQPFTPN